jgi:phytoene/squalene synthetase
MGRIYRETLETIARKEFRVFEDRIALSRARKIRLALTTWAQNKLSAVGDQPSAKGKV